MPGNFEGLLTEISALIIGLIIATCLGPAVNYFREKAFEDIDWTPPKGVRKKAWIKVTETPKEGGVRLGQLERVIFFFAFWINQPLFIGAWLAFKVASKWEMWTNIVKVPEKVEGVDEIDFLRARHQWGSKIMQSFLVGTGGNILASLVGVFVGKFLVGGW